MGGNRRSESQKERRESRACDSWFYYIVLYWLHINIYVIEGSLCLYTTNRSLIAVDVQILVHLMVVPFTHIIT